MELGAHQAVQGVREGGQVQVQSGQEKRRLLLGGQQTPHSRRAKLGASVEQQQQGAKGQTE